MMYIFLKTRLEHIEYYIPDRYDEGYGISKTEIENVFKPFYRSGETNIAAKPGTGLGLAIVKDIMDAHDGKIEVESKLGKGSTFTLKFPYEGSK